VALPVHDHQRIAAAIGYATSAYLGGLDSVPHPAAMPLWPLGWEWQSGSRKDCLRRAILLLQEELGEDWNHDTGYPGQVEVAAWVQRNFPAVDLGFNTLGLVEEIGEFCRALLKREQGVRGTYEEWTTEAAKELGDIMIKLLSIADATGFDLPTVTALRWNTVKERDFVNDPKGHGLPEGP